MANSIRIEIVPGEGPTSQEAQEDLVRYSLVLQKAANLMVEKNADYGGAWKRQGFIGNLARIMSKTSRLKALRWRDGQQQHKVSNETVEDTLLDLVNLSVFALINEIDGNRWGDK